MGTEVTATARPTTLEPEGRAYMKEILASGHYLARSILGSEILKLGEVVGFIPETSDMTPIERFNVSIGMSKENSLTRTCGLLASLCQKLRRPLLVFEDAESMRDDPWLTHVSTPIGFLGSEVYHLAPSCQPQDIRSAIAAAESSSSLIGVLGETTIQRGGLELTEVLLDEVARNAIAVVVAAFDGEGYLILRTRGLPAP